MKIVASLTSNNKFKLKTFRLADGYTKVRNVGDAERDREIFSLGKIAQELEDRRDSFSLWRCSLDYGSRGNIY